MNYKQVCESLEHVDERFKLAKIYNDNTKVGMYRGDFIDKRIKELQDEINKLKQAKSVETQMNMRGWSFFDISNDIDDEEYFMFVGTKDELFERIPNPSCYSRYDEDDEWEESL